jgi:hypothetical protein
MNSGFAGEVLSFLGVLMADKGLETGTYLTLGDDR